MAAQSQLTAEATKKEVVTTVALKRLPLPVIMKVVDDLPEVVTTEAEEAQEEHLPLEIKVVETNESSKVKGGISAAETEQTKVDADLIYSATKGTLLHNLTPLASAATAGDEGDNENQAEIPKSALFKPRGKLRHNTVGIMEEEATTIADVINADTLDQLKADEEKNSEELEVMGQGVHTVPEEVIIRIPVRNEETIEDPRLDLEPQIQDSIPIHPPSSETSDRVYLEAHLPAVPAHRLDMFGTWLVQIGSQGLHSQRATTSVCYSFVYAAIQFVGFAMRMMADVQSRERPLPPRERRAVLLLYVIIYVIILVETTGVLL